MADPLPSLALEMSMDGIALHQLAFDGHWHELARVGLSDAALREKMANMREIAQRLEGKRFKVRVWLPRDQIVRKSADIKALDQKSRQSEARSVLGNITPHSGAEFAVAVNTPRDDSKSMVAAARIKTMHEAFAFAKSHGFNAIVYSTRQPIEGFVDKPYFRLPPNHVRTAAIWGTAAVLVAALVGSAAFFKISDPYLWWETPPQVADFAPFQNPDLAVDKSNANILPSGTIMPAPPPIASISSQSLQEALPYVPARQLDATALDTIIAPPLLQPRDFDIDYSIMAEESRFSLPTSIALLIAANAADRPPSLGLYSVLDFIADIPLHPEPPLGHLVNLPVDLAHPKSSQAPTSVASIRFVLEPLPSIAVTMSVAQQRELANSFGIDVSAISASQPQVLADTQIVNVIRGLPEILPRLRSGRDIPPQVAVLQVQPTVTIIETVPADAETIANAARGFALIDGRPDILPVRRVVPPEIIEPVVAEIVPEPEITPEIIPEAIVTVINAPVEFTGEVPVVLGQPDLLPLLRSGNAIPAPGSEPEPVAPPAELPVEIAEIPVPEQANSAVTAEAVVSEIDPALAESIALANSLRARRRPQDIIEMAVPVDVMLSDAAPALAEQPPHRDAGFAANAARIIEISTNRPRAVAPIVPVDPQTVTLPTTASVARAATIENGINLRKTSLIGIFGTSDNRDVLIRMASGRILQVGLGDSFSGWRVVAIGEDSVRIQKGNRTEILRMPN